MRSVTKIPKIRKLDDSLIKLLSTGEMNFLLKTPLKSVNLAVDLSLEMFDHLTRRQFFEDEFFSFYENINNFQ